MAPNKGERESPLEVNELRRSLQTTKFELDYERSARVVEIVAKDEELRKLRVHLQLLEDENDELHEQLGDEEGRAEDLEAKIDDTHALLEEAELAKVNLTNELRLKERELNNMQAELNAMLNISADTTKVLTEKLSLARELATLRPELEHLRSTAASHATLLSEKLCLQRQLSTVQVELETEKRTAQRLMSKEGKSSESSAQLRTEISSLQKALQTERLQRENAELSAAQAQAELDKEKAAAKDAKNNKDIDATKTAELEEEVADLRKELIKERRSREKLEQDAQEAAADYAAEKQRAEKQASRIKQGKKNAEAEQSAELEGLREEIGALKKQVKAAEKSARNTQDDIETERSNIQKVTKKVIERSDELDELRNQLIEEQKERKKAERDHDRARKDWEAKKALLDEKLDAFRSKLRSTKETLKETEAELLQAQTRSVAKAASSIVTTAATKGTKGPRKRKAQVDPSDATTLGTPGDMPTKRARRSYSVAPSEKSTFSITPFLSRTASVPPESTTAGEELGYNPVETVTEATPTGPPKQSRGGSAETKPLAVATASKANPKMKQARKPTKALSTLEIVAEEGDGDENIDPTVVPEKTMETMQAPKLKSGSMPSKAPRKSLMSFATFDSEAPEKKKKRKLGGLGLQKTLFDDDEGAPPVKPIPGKGFIANRAVGRSIFGAKGPGPAISGGLRHMTEEGFMFSPLKKERKAMKEASMLIGK
ncbi:hypothetical protein EJ05DRAFT_478758 [Pseudovirgaria hyperparasitica]|uniref:Uncharacterized protein n=1 Tax=Pseudovirgaria hyperparasitica TaxID=470096 RepID=A0A6A6VYQ8_9PEZI|nr:uncharacterized protein EJ05DRAFT_478758 [Pseudovirgaria hyperparasitica]KAF2755798.1 hypothetical protein EJ05DRAFT_478758 [Pseudovirgaria hyperparasitica]